VSRKLLVILEPVLAVVKKPFESAVGTIVANISNGFLVTTSLWLRARRVFAGSLHWGVNQAIRLAAGYFSAAAAAGSACIYSKH
jgi:hypothetical protein